MKKTSSLSLVKYVLLTAFRDRVYLGLFICLIISFALSIFLGSTELLETDKATVAYIAGSSRIILIIGAILFVCLTVNRTFENREVEFIISKSVSREKFILAYLLGFLLTIFISALPLVLAIILFTKSNFVGVAIWLLSLLCELLIIISFSLVFSLILRGYFSSIAASLTFYIISRMMGVFTMAIEMPKNLSAVKGDFIASLLKWISVFFPRLDLFGQSEWLIYGITNYYNLKIIFIQSLIYIPLLVFMAFHDFKKKQF